MAKVPIPSRQSIGVPIYMIGMLYGQMVVELGHMPQRGMIIHMWSSFKIVFGSHNEGFLARYSCFKHISWDTDPLTSVPVHDKHSQKH